ncbi:hypothetical protein CHCC14814_1661 [Bacillus paralicheniformis]|nr:hypothetical protein CHCC14814_1661 [Bacillus paralicheniformis]
MPFPIINVIGRLKKTRSFNIFELLDGRFFSNNITHYIDTFFNFF